MVWATGRRDTPDAIALVPFRDYAFDLNSYGLTVPLPNPGMPAGGGGGAGFGSGVM